MLDNAMGRADNLYVSIFNFQTLLHTLSRKASWPRWMTQCDAGSSRRLTLHARRASRRWWLVLVVLSGW